MAAGHMRQLEENKKKEGDEIAIGETVEDDVAIQKREDELVQELCANSFVPFNSAVKKMDEVCQDIRVIQEQMSDLKERIQTHLKKRADAKKREAAAVAAAKASRAAADRLTASHVR